MNRLIFIIILLSLILGSFNCTKQTPKNDCNNVNKIDLLLNDVFKKKYIFPILGNVGSHVDTGNYNYLISNGLVSPSDVYYIKVLDVEKPEHTDSIKIISIDQDTIKNKMINTVDVTLKQTNTDTTNVIITVGYTNMGKYALTEATFNYIFDDKNCRWIMNDSTFWQY